MRPLVAAATENGDTDMPVVTLPDGSHREYSNPLTVAEVAADIGAGLAKAALAGKIAGRLVDTSYLIQQDTDLAIVTDRDEDGLEVIRHSTAHLLAQAVKELFPDAQVTIGPVIEDGFYYDFAYEKGFSEDDLSRIETVRLPTGSFGRTGVRWRVPQRPVVDLGVAGVRLAGETSHRRRRQR